MKKILTVVSFVSIFAIAAFLLFEGILNNQKEKSVRKVEQKVSSSQTSSSTTSGKISKSKSDSHSRKLFAANRQSDNTVRPRAARPVSRELRESERERRMEKGNRFDQPDMFVKIQKMIRTGSGKSAPTYQPNYQFTEFNKLKKNSQFMKKAANLNWVERGPANVGGRTRGIVVDPDDATKNTWYVGSVGGGIWKTTNAGTSWRDLTSELPNLSTTTLDQAQTNRNIFYAGTGEGFYNADAIAGNGIFKSTDRGETWTQLAATANNSDYFFVNRLVVDPNNENVVVAGTGKGIFKTVDGGTTWTKTSSVANIDQVISNPLNFKTLYATSNGKGVLKSFDAGNSWFDTDNKNLSGSRMEIAIAPSDTSKLYVSSDLGSGSSLFGTINGGTNWTEIKETSGTTIDWLGGQGWYDNTIAVNPYDANLVYIGGIDLWKLAISVGTPIVGISSTEKDSMEVKFSFVPGGLPFENGGVGTGNDYWKSQYLSQSDFFNVELRFGPGKGQKAARFINATMDYQNYIDVPFEAWDISSNRQLMVSFQDANKSGGFDVSSLSGDKIHFHNVTYNAATPNDSVAKINGIKYKNNFVVLLRKATGTTWNPATLPNAWLRINVGEFPSLLRASTPISDAYGRYSGSQAYVHPDQHNIVCVPMDQASKSIKMINGNDGGVALSTDGGTTFKEVGDDGYNTSQFYGVDKMSGKQAYFGGMQDNGTYFSDPALGNANAATKYNFVIGGDGFEVVWNPKDPLKMIGGSQYNGLSRTVDGWITRETPNKGFDDLGDANNSPFITKIAGSKQDPDLLFIISRKGVYRSDNFADNWVLTPITTSFQNGGSFTFAQLAISSASPQVVWAGVNMSSAGKVQVSKDGGLSFSSTNNYSTALGLLSGLDTHPIDPATAYAIFSIQGAPKILRTTNYGGAWTDITGFASSTTSTNGFPDVATYCVQVMPYDPNIIWAGTEIGIIESNDNGVSWHYSNNGFPAAAVWDMKIVDDEVVVATHGRGIWSVALPELANYKPLAVTLSPRINGNVYQGKNGIIINSTLRSAYDSTQVLIDGVKQYSIGATKEQDSVLIVPFFSTGLKKFQLVSFKDGVGYKSGVNETTLIEILAARNGYVNDFNSASTDFAGDLSVVTAPGFTDGAIHSAHPYGTNKELIYTLRVPIVVASSDATLQYDDIAIVEPGDPGSVFGDSNFWDYVIVEGSKGGEWLPLLPGYDCRSDVNWLAAYNANGNGSPGMFKTHTINLRDHFSAGDQVLIRFRLFADQFTDGWGWAIDNLKIQEAFVGVENETVPTQFELSQNYPNPFNPSTIIRYALPKEEKVTLKVYNNVGELVATLVNEVQPVGVHQVTFNASRLASGVYFYKIEAGSFNQTKKLILMK
ncbi:MAG: T9SS type A sorting domain-containing protein [Ignavibacteria bacterium]|nr:T9SS type A sorting domain-containing protein [Ignavibacteria bacterium]